jgi:YegS/Rv2252/BmrU family lipid kinase
MRTKIILNPYANRWQAKAQIPAIEAACGSAGLAFDLVVTREAGEATRLAAAAAKEGEYDAIVAAGGDSTVSEVMNGLVTAAGDGPTRPMGVLPLGTGNDLSDMARIPRPIAEAVQLIGAGLTRQMDVGRLEYDGRVHYFDNNCAAAMEPMVTIEGARMKRLSGNIRYVVALAKALIKLKAWHMRLDWDGGSHEGPLYLLSVCNSARTGGIFIIAPGAQTNDGYLDFVYATEMSKLQVLRLLPGLFKGTHVNHPKVTIARTRRLSAHSRPGTPIHADGEVITESATSLLYEVLPGKLTLLAPTDK